MVALAAAAAIYLLVVAALVVAGRKAAARAAVRLLPDLLHLFKGLLGDPRVPRGSKLMLVLAAGWIASPIDLVPEFIPILGPLDDAVIAALVLRHLLKTAGREVLEDHWAGSPETLDRLLSLFSARRAP